MQGARTLREERVYQPPNPYVAIAWTGTVALVLMSLLFAKPGSTYRWAFAFLSPLLWAVYAMRGRLALLPSHYAFFAAAVLIHDLGTFGFYETIFLGLRFDSYIHFMFGFVAGLVLYHAFREKLHLSPTALAIAVPIFILGIGGLHELFECFTTILLGPKRGMLKLRPDQPFDTQKDLMNNVLGAIAAVVGYLLRNRMRKKA